VHCFGCFTPRTPLDRYKKPCFPTVFYLIISVFWSCLRVIIRKNFVTIDDQFLLTMKNTTLAPNGELIITPAATSSAADFNFLVGTHRVHHKKLKSRLNDCSEWIEFDGSHTQEILLNGMGNLEQQKMITVEGEPIEGIALRLFSPVTKLWSIYWADSKAGGQKNSNA
jgi:hypothetical protein